MGDHTDSDLNSNSQDQNISSNDTLQNVSKILSSVENIVGAIAPAFMKGDSDNVSDEAKGGPGGNRDSVAVYEAIERLEYKVRELTKAFKDIKRLQALVEILVKRNSVIVFTDDD